MNPATATATEPPCDPWAAGTFSATLSRRASLSALTKGLAAFTSLGIITGCRTMPHEPGMDVEVTDLRLTDATVFETTAIFTIRITNETPEPILLEGGMHKFFLQRQYVGKGLSSATTEVPRFGESVQFIKVHLRHLALATKFKSILETRHADYRLDSLLYARRSDRRARVRLSKEGSLNMRDFQPQPSR